MKKKLSAILIIFVFLIVSYTSICYAKLWDIKTLNKITVKEWQEAPLKDRIEICSSMIITTYQNNILCEQLEKFLSSQIQLHQDNIYLKLLAFTLKAIIEDKIIKNEATHLDMTTATLIAMSHLKWLKQQNLNHVIHSSSSSSSEWYVGGTLHKATVKEWKNATPENKLATCADFIVAGITNNIFIANINVVTLKYYSQELVNFINASTRENQLLDNYKISELATLGVTMMDWLKNKN